MADKLNSRENQLDLMITENSKLNKLLTTQGDEINKITKKNEYFEKKLEFLIEENTNLRNELENKGKCYEEIRIKLEEFKSKENEFFIPLEISIGQYQTITQNLEQKIKELIRENSELLNKCNDICLVKEKINFLEAESDEMKENLKKKNNEFDELNKMNRNLVNYFYFNINKSFS